MAGDHPLQQEIRLQTVHQAPGDEQADHHHLPVHPGRADDGLFPLYNNMNLVFPLKKGESKVECAKLPKTFTGKGGQLKIYYFCNYPIILKAFFIFYPVIFNQCL